MRMFYQCKDCCFSSLWITQYTISVFSPFELCVLTVSYEHLIKRRIFTRLGNFARSTFIMTRSSGYCECSVLTNYGSRICLKRWVSGLDIFLCGKFTTGAGVVQMRSNACREGRNSLIKSQIKRLDWKYSEIRNNHYICHVNNWYPEREHVKIDDVSDDCQMYDIVYQFKEKLIQARATFVWITLHLICRTLACNVFIANML